MQILREVTADLKAEYLNRVASWAVEQVERNIARRLHYSSSSWKLIRDMSVIEKKDYYTEQKFYYDSPDYYFNTTEFTKRELRNAEIHYEDTLCRLSYRLIQKEMTPLDTKIKKARIGMNLEVTLSNDIYQVHAWTIVASGPVQRPHYRYLVK